MNTDTNTDDKNVLEEEVTLLTKRVQDLEKDNKQIKQLVDMLDSSEVVSFQDGDVWSLHRIDDRRGA